MAFQNQFQFVLPRGYVDKDGKVHRDGTMRMATAMDEIAPLQDPRVEQNRAYLVILLLSRVIVKLGDLEKITTDVVENLFSVDLAFLQDFYRRVNEDMSTSIPMKCPSCSHDFKYDMSQALGES